MRDPIKISPIYHTTTEMKMKRTNIAMILAKIPMDAAMISLAYITAFNVRMSESITIDKPEFVFFLIKAAALYVAVNGFLNAYSLKKENKEDHTILSLMIWFGITVAYYFFKQKLFFSRFILVGGITFGFLYIKMGRILLREFTHILHTKGIGQSKILIIGYDANIHKVIAALQKDSDKKIIGYLSDGEVPNTAISHEGNIKDYKNIIKSHEVDEIIQVSEHATHSFDILNFCLQNQVIYRFIPTLTTLHTQNIDVEQVGDIPLVTLKPTPLDGWGRVVKRIIDIIGSLAGLIITCPLWIITAIGVKSSSPGPIFVRLERINQGKPFTMYKFRSMIIGAEAMKDQLIQEGQNERGDGPLFKMENDPRVTRFGQFIRNTRLDELPQLFNILKGNMSLVGPRPHEAKEIEKYQAHHLKTLNIKPGATGIAQISGNSDLKFEEEARLDLYYIENWSILWDIKIILKTILFLLKKQDKNV